MEFEINKLDDYRAEKEKFKTQKDKVLPNVKEFYKGRKVILMAFENDAFPLAKQYPVKDSDHGWREDELDSPYIIPEKTDKLIPSLKRKKTKTKKEKVLEEVAKSNYETYNDLDKLVDKAEKYLDSDLIQKDFNFNTLGDMLNYLFKKKDSCKNPVRVSLIKAGLRDLKNEIKQMPRIVTTENRPDMIVNLWKFFLMPMKDN